jgi:hypothetical protein
MAHHALASPDRRRGKADDRPERLCDAYRDAAAPGNAVRAGADGDRSSSTGSDGETDDEWKADTGGEASASAHTCASARRFIGRSFEAAEPERDPGRPALSTGARAA